MGFLRLPLVLFGAGLLLLTMGLLVARHNPSHAYWITAEGGNVGEYGLYRMRPDGKARRVADFGAITGHAWSPDGRSMVVAVAEENGPSGSNLYRVQANGEIIGRVLVATQDLFHPAFSPDGRCLTFTTRGATMGFQINQLDLSTGIVTRMIQGSGGAMMGAWSPDSTMLAYSAQRSDYGADIYLRQFGSAAEKEGENGQTLILTSANGADASPEFSPDGKWIAFMSDRTGSFHIYVMRTDGSEAHLIGGRIRDERWPVWTPDGEWVIFSSIQGDGTPTLYQMRPDGTGLQRLSHLPLAAAKCSPLIDRTWQPMELMLLVVVAWGQWVRRWRGALG